MPCYRTTFLCRCGHRRDTHDRRGCWVPALEARELAGGARQVDLCPCRSFTRSLPAVSATRRAGRRLDHEVSPCTS